MPAVSVAPGEIASAVLSRLLGLVAHDLRNPLATIQSSAAFVSEANARNELGGLGSSADVAEALADVLLSCNELGHLIDNLQALSHALLLEPPLDREPTPLRDVVAGVVAQSEAGARSRSVTLELVTEASPLVRAHAGMLERAIANLVQNAISYAPAGSSVRVLVKEEGTLAVTRVEDTGPALDPTLGAVAFSAEGQLRGKTTRGGRYSRGLGLFCAAVAARATGAEIRVSAPGPTLSNAFELVLEAV